MCLVFFFQQKREGRTHALALRQVPLSEIPGRRGRGKAHARRTVVALPDNGHLVHHSPHHVPLEAHPEAALVIELVVGAHAPQVLPVRPLPRLSLWVPHWALNA